MGNKSSRQSLINHQSQSRNDIKNIEAIQKDYMNLIKNQQHILYQRNLHLTINKTICLKMKSFNDVSHSNIDYGFGSSPKSIDWKSYLIKQTGKLAIKGSQWAMALLHFLYNDAFFKESHFLSLFFYLEYELNTKPKCMFQQQIKHQSSSHQCKMDVDDGTINLSGSFVSFSSVKLLPDEPTIEYHIRRNLLKAYIKVFKEHLFNHEHPIHLVIIVFVKEIVKEIREDRNVHDSGFLLKKYVKHIQSFIVKFQAALKLFYSKTINYDCFVEEKDEFINLVSYLVFQAENGLLYRELYSLYQNHLQKKIAKLKEKMTEMSDITLKDLGLKKHFRLDESTFGLIKTLIKEKSVLWANDNNNSQKEKLNKLEQIMTTKHIEQTMNQVTNHRFTINSDEEYQNENESLIGSHKMTNNKQYKNLIGTLNEEHLIQVHLPNKKNSIGEINEIKYGNKPYASAIALLRSIHSYEVPFQKMLVIANLSLEITKCIQDFWKGMNLVVSMDILSLDPDELMSIFVYIMIKANIPEIVIYQQMITDFTTPTTKSSMIGYYYTTVEAVISYLINLTDINNLQDKLQRSSFLPDPCSFTNAI